MLATTSNGESMTFENTNSAASANESALSQPLSLDDAMNFSIADLDEDTSEVEEETQSNGENGEDVEVQETELADDAESEDGDEAGDDTDEVSTHKEEPADEVHITVNGEKLPLKELKAGYMRQADYSRKTQETAQQRRDLEALSARVTQSVEVVADFLVNQIPNPPDPQLAMTNPAAFVQQKAMYEQAMQNVNALLSQAGQSKDVVNTLTAEQCNEMINSENAKLAQAFPVTATKEGREQFFNVAANAARELGYTQEEIAEAVDSRIFALAHYAAIGMRAEKAKSAAKQKVANAPPVAPQKSRQQGTNSAVARRNQDAVKRLAKTGSIEDALSIDFD